MTTRQIGTMYVLASILIASERAEAQAVGSRAGWGGVDLLGHPVVREELKLDGGQVERARGLASGLREKQRGLVAGLEGLTGEAREGKSREMAAGMGEAEAAGLAKLLRPDQLARFGQIDLQQRGASSWLDAKVAGPLGLQPDQAGKLAVVLDRAMARRREAQSSTRGDRRATAEKIRAIRKDVDAEAVALLTPDQQATWRGMIGGPVDLDPPARPAR